MSAHKPLNVFIAYEKAGFGFERGMAALHDAPAGWQEVPFSPSLRMPGMGHDDIVMPSPKAAHPCAQPASSPEESRIRHAMKRLLGRKTP